jgi:hypothetical protein
MEQKFFLIITLPLKIQRIKFLKNHVTTHYIIIPLATDGDTFKNTINEF